MGGFLTDEQMRKIDEDDKYDKEYEDYLLDLDYQKWREKQEQLE